jgi:hypothetical protein
MEIADPSGEAYKRHKWLERLRLEPPPPHPESWVPVVRALKLTDSANGTSNLGDALVDLLSKAKIEAVQHPYVWHRTRVSAATGLSSGSVKSQVAVMVHARDLAPAIAIATDLQKRVEEISQASLPSAEELTRQALEAGERLHAARRADEAASQNDAQREDQIA